MVVCKICKKEFKVLTWSHLCKIHNLTVDEYEKRFDIIIKASKSWNKGLTKNTNSELKRIGEIISETRKGKSYEELMGKKKADIRKKELSEWMKKDGREKKIGILRDREKQRKTLIETLKDPKLRKRLSKSNTKAWKDPIIRERYKEAFKKRKSYIGENNPSFGTINRGSGRGKCGFRKDIGIYVRSTWEANIIRILNYLSLNYSYEPKRFLFVYNGIKLTYTPDILCGKIWYEIKGFLNEDDALKLNLFVRDISKNLTLILGNSEKKALDSLDKRIKIIDYSNLEKKFRGGIMEWE